MAASSAPAAVLSVHAVSKAFGATQALRDVSFDVRPGSVHGLLGGNGSGKSTLIKILAGVLAADHGAVSVAGERRDLTTVAPAAARRMGISVVHQQPSTFPALTVAENLTIGRGFERRLGGLIAGRRVRARVADVLEEFRIDASPQQRLGELGPAVQTMIAVARALQRPPDGEPDDGRVLILDEPTAALAQPEVERLLESLQGCAAAGYAIVLVTHRLDEVLSVADRATILRDGRVTAEVEPKAMTHETLVESMLGPVATGPRTAVAREPGRVVCEAADLRCGRAGPVSFRLRENEIVGVAGLMGAGRSTLLRGVFGAQELEGGTLSLDGGPMSRRSPGAARDAGIAYVPEDRQADAAFPELSVRENLSIAKLDPHTRAGVIRRPSERRSARDLADRFLVRTGSIEGPLATLSGGNQQKVVLARSLQRAPRLLLLDEPTQGVDVGARAEIHALLLEQAARGTAVLVVSSDFGELASLCDRVLVLRRGRIAAELTGDAMTEATIERLAHGEAAAAR